MNCSDYKIVIGNTVKIMIYEIKKNFKVRSFINNLFMLLPALFTLCFVLSLFYSSGAYFLDAGWFNHAICATRGQNTSVQTEFWGSHSIFGIHTFISQTLICNTVQIFSKNAVNSFAFLVAIGTFMATLVGLNIASPIMQTRVQRVLFALFFSFSGFVIGSTSYPHPECFAASFAALGLITLFRNIWLGWILLGIGLLGREDIGLHITITCVVVLLLCDQPIDILRRLKTIAIVSTTSSALSLIMQRVFWKTKKSVLDLTYFGQGKTWIFHNIGALPSRVSIWIQDNPGILGLFLLLLVLHFVSKQKIFLVPIFASIPWILINLIASDPAKQTLSLYESFPFIIYLASLALYHSDSNDINFRKQNVSKIFLLLGFWIAIFGSVAGGQEGSGGSFQGFFRYLTKLPSNYLSIQNHKTSLTDYIKTHLYVRLDPSVAALLPQFEDRIINSNDPINGVKTIVFNPNYVLDLNEISTFSENNGRAIVKYCALNNPIEIESTIEVSASELEQMGLKVCTD